MSQLEGERRPAIPRDFRLGNPSRIARQHDSVPLFDDDVIAQGLSNDARRHYNTWGEVTVIARRRHVGGIVNMSR